MIAVDLFSRLTCLAIPDFVVVHGKKCKEVECYLFHMAYISIRMNTRFTTHGIVAVNKDTKLQIVSSIYESSPFMMHLVMW